MLASIRAALESVHPVAPYAFLAFCLWAGAYCVRRWLPGVWRPLAMWPSPASPVAHVIQALPTTIIGAAWAGFTTGGDLREFVFGAVAGVCAPVWHHVLKLLPGPYRGALNDAAARLWRDLERASKGLLVLSTVGLTLLSSPAVTGCIPQRPSSSYVESGAALAYSSAVVALELLDAVEAQRLAAMATPSDAELAAAEVRVRRLELARDALALAREYLTGARPTDDVRGPLADGVRLLRQAAEAEGARVPPRAAEALRMAEAWLGGGDGS